MTKKRLEQFRNGTDGMDEETLRRYHRNKTMIDLSQIPANYQTAILEEYSIDKEVGRSELFNFFVNRKLKNLISDIQDF